MSFGFSARYNVEGLSCGGPKTGKIPAMSEDFAGISGVTYANIGDSQPDLTHN
jgi:hypothetical protein